MRNVKPTPIDLAEYAVHDRDCDARMFYVKCDPDDPTDMTVNCYGECDCGLNDLLDALGLRYKDGDNI
jgi:hypothetical protein